MAWTQEVEVAVSQDHTTALHPGWQSKTPSQKQTDKQNKLTKNEERQSEMHLLQRDSDILFFTIIIANNEHYMCQESIQVHNFINSLNVDIIITLIPVFTNPILLLKNEVQRTVLKVD